MSCTRITYTGIKMGIGWSTTSEADALLETALITQKLIKAVNINYSRDTVEDSGAGDYDKTYEDIQRDATLSIDGYDDKTTHELENIFDPDTEGPICGWLVIYPLGRAVGNAYEAYEVIPTGFTKGMEYNNKVAVTITLQKTGVRSTGTVSV